MTKQPNITQEDVANHPNAVGVQWHGDYFAMLCPFHEDHSPSLLVYADGFNCRSASCGQKGMLPRLYRQLGVAPPKADLLPKLTFSWSEICDGPGAVPREDFIALAHMTVQFPDVKGWYTRRGLTDDTINRCQLGWWRGWFVTPVFSERHEPIRVILRAGPSIEDNVPQRYMVSPGEAVLYVPDWGLLNTKPAYLCFPWGVYDALTTVQLRHPTVTGAGPCTDLPINLLEPFRRRIYVIPDGQPPEEIAKARHVVNDLGWRGRLIELDYPDDVKDPNGFLQTNRGALLERQLGRWCYE
jgi:hypothetical protein